MTVQSKLLGFLMSNRLLLQIGASSCGLSIETIMTLDRLVLRRSAPHVRRYTGLLIALKPLCMPNADTSQSR